MTELILSNSRLNTAHRCWNLYRYKYVMGLKKKQRSLPLERGSWIHELLMVDADGEDWKVRHKLLTAKFRNLWQEDRDELGDLPTECARIFLNYKRHYRSDRDRYVVVDTELDETVTLPNGVQLRIIIDRVVEDTIDGGLWLWDHKTRANFENIDSMMLDPQLTLYFAGAEILGYQPVRGVMYDEIRTKAPTVPALLKNGSLSKAKNIDTDVFTYMSEIRRQELDPADYADILAIVANKSKDKFLRRTPLPKDPPVLRQVVREAMATGQQMLDCERRDAYPRCHDKSCNWCDYKDLCLAELYGGDITPLINMNYTDRRVKDEDAK